MDKPSQHIHTARQMKDWDDLTGLPGYPAFMRDLDRWIAAEETVAIGLVDLDMFGKLNEAYGDAAGDAVLRLLAESLREAVAGQGAIYRYGGDAFGVLFRGGEKEQAFLTLEAARSAFSGKRVVTVQGESLELAVAVSVGVACIPDDGADPTEAVRKANEALYRAKSSGRNKAALAREEKMVTKTSHYSQGQLQGLSRLAKRMGVGEAMLLREALDDLLRKYNA